MGGIGYPDVAELVRHEQKTLQFLKDVPFIKTASPIFARAAEDAYLRTKRPGACLAFESHFSGPEDAHERMIYVGVRIDRHARDPNVSHYLAICDHSKTPPRLLRKFHFDYDPVVREPGRPFMHMQYAGELTPLMQDSCIEHDHADPWFSEPRMPCAPVSLAMLIHLAFKEFRDEGRAKFIERPDWKGLVRESEKLMCTPFYRTCVQTLDRKDKLLFDFFDGK